MSKRKARQGVGELVPLAERVLVLMAFRLVATAAVLALQLTLTVGIDAQRQWVIASSYLGVTGLLSLPALSRRRGLTLRCFGLTLLIDGLFLEGERAIG